MPAAPALLGEYYAKLLQCNEVIMSHSVGASPGLPIGRRVSEIARRASVSSRDAAVLYRLACYLKPRHILELGTCLGHSTIALACGAPSALLYSIEGNADLQSVAGKHLAQAGLDGVILINDTFRNALPRVLEEVSGLDLVFLDGDHRKEETIFLCQSILPALSSRGVLAIHDIHWSNEMIEAWDIVQELPEVTASITTFSTAYLFVSESLSHQRFRLRF